MGGADMVNVMNVDGTAGSGSMQMNTVNAG